MRDTKAILIEALMVAAFGLVFSLAANALSPRGLRLARNYFPGGEKPVLGVANGTNSITSPVVTNGSWADPSTAVLRRLQEHGLQSVSSKEVAQLFRDPGYAQGLVAFVDARDERNYQSGHIPGAWQFDHYRAEQYLPSVMAVCLGAQKVVVYCSGGNCEDSEFAAVMLRDAGVPAESLFVYPGGISEWTTNGLPLEVGARGSGELVTRER
jgi:rhodanese-related sulfurtransferase